MSNSGRLHGLDLARFAAFAGMVIVNFKVVMVPEAAGTGILESIVGSLEGRAAATFVVLAGIGLGLSSQRQPATSGIAAVTIKRAAFLLAIGLLNSIVFSADILHYYAFYFLFGVACINLPAKRLILLHSGPGGSGEVRLKPLCENSPDEHLYEPASMTPGRLTPFAAGAMNLRL